MDRENINLSEVQIPDGLDNNQVERAQKYFYGTVIEGLSATDTCKKYNLSSATLWNHRHLKNPTFNKYIRELTKSVTDENEVDDHLFIADKIKQNAMKPNANYKDYELYAKYWGWMFQYVENMKREELGIPDKNGNSTGDNRTVEQKKQSLLKRLKNKEDTDTKGNDE